ncbi:MAG: DUF2617 family protein [Planctomycetaceae bacterium]
MSIPSARSSVSDLVFHVYRRSVHPELFKTYVTSHLSTSKWNAELRIGDVGHLVSFRMGDQILTEMTATERTPLPHHYHCLERRVRGQRNETLEIIPGLRYQVSFQVEQLEQDVFLHVHEEMLTDARKAQLAFHFPPAHRFLPGAVSLVNASPVFGGLLVHTFHTFPDSCAVVKTQSLYEVG